MSETYESDFSFDDNTYVGGRSGFIVGGEEPEGMNKVYTGGYSTGGYSTGGYNDYSGNYGLTSIKTCFSVFLVIIVLLVLMKLLSKDNVPKRKPMRIMMNQRPISHGNKFDKLLIPSSYFEYDRYGTQFINWG